MCKLSRNDENFELTTYGYKYHKKSARTLGAINYENIVVHVLNLINTCKK